MATDPTAALTEAATALTQFTIKHDAVVNTISVYMGGTIDDPDSFDSLGRPSTNPAHGALGYYYVLDGSGEPRLLPCWARFNAIAAGNADMPTLDSLLSGKVAASAAAQAGAEAARDEAQAAAGTAADETVAAATTAINAATTAATTAAADATTAKNAAIAAATVPTADFAGNHTAATADQGYRLRFTGATAHTLTLPSSGVTVGTRFLVRQAGTGSVTFSGLPSSGDGNPLGHTILSGQGSEAALELMPAIGGGSPYWAVTGDTA